MAKTAARRHRPPATPARAPPQVRVVGVPCLSCNNPLLAGRAFDVAFVDEAGQITLPAVLGPLLISSTFVLVRARGVGRGWERGREPLGTQPARSG